MAKKAPAYAIPPKAVFRRLGLGRIVDGRIKVIAGFQDRWWTPFQEDRVQPLFVDARVIRINQPTLRAVVRMNHPKDVPHA